MFQGAFSWKITIFTKYRILNEENFLPNKYLGRYVYLTPQTSVFYEYEVKSKDRYEAWTFIFF